jgi:spore germination cell wall hydrolase CwlJ-like protein
MLARCMAFAIALAVPATADDAPASEPLAKAEACLAEAVYFEARGTSATARAAVAYVVSTARKTPTFPPRSARS